MNALNRFFGRDDGEEGQAVVLFAIMMLALLFAVGLAIDAGQLYSAKRAEQEAADAAAFAGAVVLYQLGTGSEAISAARTDALTNGYVSGGGCLLSTQGPCYDAATQTTVAVYWPPISGNYLGNLKHVEVSITRQVKTSLVPAEAAFNPVRARGVAGSEPLNNGYAVMALNRAPADASFYADKNSDVHLNGGGILVNSGSGTAAINNQDDTSRFTVQTPYALDVNGGATGQWANDSVPVNTGHQQVPDPFAGFPKPSTTGVPIFTSIPNGSTVTLDPGVYKVKIKGSGSQTFNFNPGVYILEAGMDTSGNAAASATNSFFYNTYSTYPAAPGASPTCGDMELSGNGIFSFTAQTTGTWANLLFYQDPACHNDFTVAGNGTFTGTGSIYLPAAQFVFAGNNATLYGSQIVAQTVTCQTGNLTINYNPVNTAQPILPRLAE